MNSSAETPVATPSRAVFQLSDWISGNAISHLAFFLLSLGAFLYCVFSEQQRDNALYFFFVQLFWLIIAWLNAARARSSTTAAIALTCIIVNLFLIPLSLVAFGLSMVSATLIGVLYLVTTLCLSPAPIALGALVAGIAFALLQRSGFTDLPDTASDSLLIATAYTALAILAFSWRLMLIALYRLFTTPAEQASLIANASEQQLESQADDSSKILEENRILREQIAMHIVSVDELIGALDEPQGSLLAN